MFAMDLLFLLGRVILGSYFIMSGYNHLAKLEMMSQYAASKGVPKIMVIITGLQLLVGGLSILLGVYPQLGALLLVAFLMPVAFIMHNFWQEKDQMMKMTQMVNFTKNLALAGALLIISTISSWPYSLRF